MFLWCIIASFCLASFGPWWRSSQVTCSRKTMCRYIHKCDYVSTYLKHPQPTRPCTTSCKGSLAKLFCRKKGLSIHFKHYCWCISWSLANVRTPVWLLTKLRPCTANRAFPARSPPGLLVSCMLFQRKSKCLLAHSPPGFLCISDISLSDYSVWTQSASSVAYIPSVFFSNCTLLTQDIYI